MKNLMNKQNKNKLCFSGMTKIRKMINIKS